MLQIISLNSENIALKKSSPLEASDYFLGRKKIIENGYLFSVV